MLPQDERVLTENDRRAADRRMAVVVDSSERPFAAPGGLAVVRLGNERAQADHVAAQEMLAIRNGDELATAALYARIAPQLRSVAATILGNAHEAEDCVQEIMIALPRFAERFDPERGSVGGLLTKATQRLALSMRAKSRRVVLDPLSAGPGGHSASDPQGSLDTGWLLSSSLSVQQRRIIWLRYELDLPFETIGRLVDGSAASVRQAHLRALRALQDSPTYTEISRSSEWSSTARG